MKNNKKGFTLIELLAVIVILAIIMVIAIPQILNVINNSRRSSWDNSVKLVARAIDLNNTLDQTGVTNGNDRTGYPLSELCSSSSLNTGKFGSIVESGDIALSESDTTNSSCTSPSNANGEYVFTIYGRGQFKGYSAKITCSTSSACTTSDFSYATN